MKPIRTRRRSDVLANLDASESAPIAGRWRPHPSAAATAAGAVKPRSHGAAFLIPVSPTALCLPPAVPFTPSQGVCTPSPTSIGGMWVPHPFFQQWASMVR